MRSINDLLREADAFISEKTASGSPSIDLGNVSKLAADLMGTCDGADDDHLEYTVTEKLASAIAISNVLLNLPKIQKLAALECQAKENGVSDERIAEVLEKNAGSLEFRSILDYL
jgi:hypothetical protein